MNDGLDGADEWQIDGRWDGTERDRSSIDCHLINRPINQPTPSSDSCSQFHCFTLCHLLSVPFCPFPTHPLAANDTLQ